MSPIEGAQIALKEDVIQARRDTAVRALTHRVHALVHGVCRTGGAARIEVIDEGGHLTGGPGCSSRLPLRE
jgi:hypothetical protein